MPFSLTKPVYRANHFSEKQKNVNKLKGQLNLQEQLGSWKKVHMVPPRSSAQIPKNSEPKINQIISRKSIVSKKANHLSLLKKLKLIMQLQYIA